MVQWNMCVSLQLSHDILFTSVYQSTPKLYLPEQGVALSYAKPLN